MILPPRWGDSRLAACPNSIVTHPLRMMWTGKWHKDERHQIKNKKASKRVNAKRPQRRKRNGADSIMELLMTKSVDDGISHTNQRIQMQHKKRGNHAKSTIDILTHSRAITTRKGHEVIIQSHYSFAHATDSKFQDMKMRIQIL